MRKIEITILIIWSILALNFVFAIFRPEPPTVTPVITKEGSTYFITATSTMPITFKKPCTEYENTTIKNVPARCFKYFLAK